METLFTSGSSPLTANFHQQQSEGFLICRRCRCIKKDSTFILAEIAYFFCYLMMLITTSPKESNFVKGKITTGEKGETPVAVSRGLHESLHLLSKF